MTSVISPYDPKGTKKRHGKPRVVLKRRYVSDVIEVEEKPPPKPLKIHDSGVNEEILSELAYAFELLYDPNYSGHLSFEEQLKKFKSRDLLETKLYKTALKAFGNQRFVRERLAKDNGRKRVFVAQPLSELRGIDSFSEASCLPNIHSTAERISVAEDQTDARQDPATIELSRYQEWLRKRQTQHKDLERMGDVESYLRGRGQLSSMEKSALRRIEESRRPKASDQLEEEVTDVHAPAQMKVSVKRPSPLALFIIDTYLRKKKLRLADLFTSFDKDKDWLLTREEFRKAMRQNRVPLPEPLLEDMIITLDQDNNNQLDYRELAQGLDHYRREKRTPEFLALLSEESNQFLLSRGTDSLSMRPGTGGDTSEASRETGAASPMESVSSVSLRPGMFDTSQERYSVNNAEESAELRRRDRVALKYMRSGRHRQEEFRSMVKTFDKDIDDHVTPSTLPERPMAEMVDAFRHRQLREFMSIVDACKEKDVVFSERMYRRVFLYPADRSKKTIGKQVRPPGDNSDVPLNVFLRPADRASIAAGRRSVGRDGIGGGEVGAHHLQRRATSDTNGNWRKVHANSMARVGRGLPTSHDLLIDDDDAEEELPTGTALIRRKVDCWLTFEEFEKLTAGLDYSKQAGLRGPNRDAFWPGRLEGRVRRFLEIGQDSVFGPGVFFQPTAPPPGNGDRRSHSYLPHETWPVNQGHVTYGSIDPMLAYEITGKRSLQRKVAL